MKWWHVKWNGQISEVKIEKYSDQSEKLAAKLEAEPGDLMPMPHEYRRPSPNQTAIGHIVSLRDKIKQAVNAHYGEESADAGAIRMALAIAAKTHAGEPIDDRQRQALESLTEDKPGDTDKLTASLDRIAKAIEANTAAIEVKA